MNPNYSPNVGEFLFSPQLASFKSGALSSWGLLLTFSKNNGEQFSNSVRGIVLLVLYLSCELIKVS